MDTGEIVVRKCGVGKEEHIICAKEVEEIYFEPVEATWAICLDCEKVIIL